jgi:hypothetical protein
MMKLVFGKALNLLFGLIMSIGLLNAQMASADHLYEGDAFYGDWSVSNSVMGNIRLGDGGGWMLDLRSTERWCAKRGTGYSTMQSYIRSNYPDGVSWFVDAICNDGYVRICVYSARGNIACSTYADYGWREQ